MHTLSFQGRWVGVYVGIGLSVRMRACICVFSYSLWWCRRTWWSKSWGTFKTPMTSKLITGMMIILGLAVPPLVSLTNYWLVLRIGGRTLSHSTRFRVTTISWLNSVPKWHNDPDYIGKTNITLTYIYWNLAKAQIEVVEQLCNSLG